MKASDFDAAAHAGEDIDAAIDWSKARRPNIETRRVNVDFPGWMIAALDRQAKRLGISRQALIKSWIAEKLD